MSSSTGIGGLSTALDEVSSNEFDLFAPIEVEHSIGKAYDLSYRPIASTDGKGPFTFEIPQDPHKFIAAETIRLIGHMRIRKVETDGTVKNISSNDSVSCVNNIFQSLWSQIDVYINGTSITDPSEKWYAYKAYLENLLSYSTASKQVLGEGRGWIADDENEFEDMGESATIKSKNSGYIKRESLFTNSKWVDF